MSTQVPFSDPPWLLGLPSPYYTESHRKWQAALRPLLQKLLHDKAVEWEVAETVPPHVFREFAASNLLVAALPAPLPADLLKNELGIHELPGGLRVEEFDSLHGLIFADEMARSGLVGPSGSLTTGMAFGVPPILKFGSEELKKRLLPDLLTGRKRSCIAITEPDAGSDVAGITTTAVKSECGRYYVVNGSKKWYVLFSFFSPLRVVEFQNQTPFTQVNYPLTPTLLTPSMDRITNGIWADYATTAVRTGGPGPGGLSLLVVPLRNPDGSHYQGVTTRRIRPMGVLASGTTFIEFDDVRVPAGNLLGREGQGMGLVMTNFNHERLVVAAGTTRQARVALSSAFEYVLKREAFGRRLVEQAVVRHRLAKAGALLESHSAWLEQFAYMLTKLPRKDADRELGGLTALLKANAGLVFKECADVAVLLFGGNGLTRSGQGQLIESESPPFSSYPFLVLSDLCREQTTNSVAVLYREVPATRVPGGSEDVMLDLAIRQLAKLYQAKTKALAAGKL